jgi:hypothetical protein
MPNDRSVIADPASGAAVVAGTRVAMSASANGAFRFGGAGGRVLRPLTFGERTELVSAASALPAARDAVAAAILAAATLEPGEGAATLMEALAMWLAGAAFDGPDFMKTTLLVARAAGWPPHELFAAQAREIDRLAVQLDEQRRASEWTSLVFAEAPAETIDAVRARFADRLLHRSNAAVVEEESSEERTAAGAAREHAERRSLPVHAATAPSESERPARSQRHETSHRLTEMPSPEAAPSRPTSAHDEATATQVRPPSVRGVRMIVPAEERDRSARGVRTESAAGIEQRPALAFSIRKPRPSGTRDVADIAKTTAAPQASVNVGATLPQFGSALRNVATAAAVVDAFAVAREERSIPGFEPQREIRKTPLPERAPANAPRTIAEHPEDVAATLALLLDDEADLRGVDR